MNYKYLILKGTAGLGNRLITLSNAINYAAKSGRTLLVDWSDGQFAKKDINIFHQYFQLVNTPNIKSIEEINNFKNLTHYPPIWGKNPHASLYDLYIQASANHLKKLLPFPLKSTSSKIQGYWRLKNNKLRNSKSDLEAVKSLLRKNDIPFGGRYTTKRKEDIVFFADFCPEFDPEILKNHVSLTKKMNSEIERLSNELQLSQKTIGVHVRMTDKRPISDLNSLLGKIKATGINDPRIFLATDTEEVEHFFKAHFNKVVFTPKWRPENKKNQIGVHQYAIRSRDYTHAEQMLKESIIDMWLLSKCEHLFYQENSSFSRISAVLKGEPTKTFSW